MLRSLPRAVEYARSVWLATIAFAGAFGVGTYALGTDAPAAAQFAATALVVTPIIWGLVAPGGRMAYLKGASAGAIVGPLVWVLTLAIVIFLSSIVGSRDAIPPDPSGKSWGTLILVMGGFVGALIAIPIGAGLGLVIVWVEKKRNQRTTRGSGSV